MELTMLIGAKKLTMADDAFTSRQVYAAMDAAHHILARLVRWRFIPLGVAAATFQDAVSDPESQSEKYQLNQTSPAPSAEIPVQ